MGAHQERNQPPPGANWRMRMKDKIYHSIFKERGCWIEPEGNPVTMWVEIKSDIFFTNIELPADVQEEITIKMLEFMPGVKCAIISNINK